MAAVAFALACRAPDERMPRALSIAASATRAAPDPTMRMPGRAPASCCAVTVSTAPRASVAAMRISPPPPSIALR